MLVLDRVGAPASGDSAGPSVRDTACSASEICARTACTRLLSAGAMPATVSARLRVASQLARRRASSAASSVYWRRLLLEIVAPCLELLRVEIPVPLQALEARGSTAA